MRTAAAVSSSAPTSISIPVRGRGRRSNSPTGRDRPGRPPTRYRRRLQPAKCSPWVSTSGATQRGHQLGSGGLDHHHRRVGGGDRKAVLTGRRDSHLSADRGQLGQVALAPLRGRFLGGQRRRSGERFLKLVHALQKRPELELSKQLGHARTVGGLHHHVVEIERQRHVAIDGGKLLELRATSAPVRSDSRRLSPETASRFAEDALHRAELDQQLGGGLLADARHAVDVVRGVALEGDEVGNLLGVMP